MGKMKENSKIYVVGFRVTDEELKQLKAMKANPKQKMGDMLRSKVFPKGEA